MFLFQPVNITIVWNCQSCGKRENIKKNGKILSTWIAGESFKKQPSNDFNIKKITLDYI